MNLKGWVQICLFYCACNCVVLKSMVSFFLATEDLVNLTKLKVLDLRHNKIKEVCDFFFFSPQLADCFDVFVSSHKTFPC